MEQGSEGAGETCFHATFSLSHPPPSPLPEIPEISGMETKARTGLRRTQHMVVMSLKTTRCSGVLWISKYRLQKAARNDASI